MDHCTRARSKTSWKTATLILCWCFKVKPDAAQETYQGGLRCFLTNTMCVTLLDALTSFKELFKRSTLPKICFFFWVSNATTPVGFRGAVKSLVVSCLMKNSLLYVRYNWFQSCHKNCINPRKWIITWSSFLGGILSDELMTSTCVTAAFSKCFQRNLLTHVHYQISAPHHQSSLLQQTYFLSTPPLQECWIN